MLLDLRFQHRLYHSLNQNGYGYVTLPVYIIYLYIYWIRIWHLTVPVESRKAQLEAMQSSKQSDSERDFGRDSAGNAKALSNPTTLARAAALSAKAGAAFASVAEHEKACSSVDVEH